MRFRKIHTGGNSRDDGGSFALKSLARSPEKCIGPAKLRFKIVFEHRRSLGTFDHDYIVILPLEAGCGKVCGAGAQQSAI